MENRNSKEAIEKDIAFINGILKAVKKNELHDAKTYLRDWRHELTEVLEELPQSPNSPITQ